MASGYIEKFTAWLGIDLDKASFQKLGEKINGFNKKLSSLGKAGGFLYFVNKIDNITQKIIDATEATSNWAVELERAARRSGIDSGVLERLRIIEEEQGLEQGVIENALEHIQDVKATFAGGGGLDEGFLRSLISIQGDPAQVLERIIEHAQGKSLLYQKLLSQRTGVDMSLFELYGKDISKIAESRLFTPEQKKDLIEMNKNFGSFNSKWRTLKNKLILLTMPLVEKLLKLANTFLSKVLNQLDEILKDENAMNRINTILSSIVTVVGVLVLRFLPVLLSGIGTLFSILIDISGLGIFKNIVKLGPLTIKGITKTGGALKTTGKGIAAGAKWFWKFLEKNFPHVFGLLKEAGKWGKNIGKAFSKTGGFIGKVFSKIGTAIGFLSGKLAKLLGWLFTPLKKLISFLWIISKGILKISFAILTSPITWIIGSLTLIGAIIGDLISYCLTGEAKISKGLLEFVNKHFPAFAPFFKSVHDFMSQAGKDVKVLFDMIDERFKIVDKMKTVLDGWHYTFGGGKEELEAAQKAIDEKNARLQAELKRKQFNDNLNYMNQNLGTQFKIDRYRTNSWDKNSNEVTVNNNNNFMLDGVDNPDQYANAVSKNLQNNSFKRGLNVSGNVFGNVG